MLRQPDTVDLMDSYRRCFQFSRFTIVSKQRSTPLHFLVKKKESPYCTYRWRNGGENPSDIQLNLRSGCGRLPQSEWFSQTCLKKQYHMCKLIYEVLTRGPERISILLGKCFPLGSVSATAYSCFRSAEKARLFPPQHE